MDREETEFKSDTPLRLDVAVKVAFPAGGLTVAGLRKEIARGRLEVELIAGKHFTTLAAIERMRERCRVIKEPSLHEGLSQRDVRPARANHASGAELVRFITRKLDASRAERRAKRMANKKKRST